MTDTARVEFTGPVDGFRLAYDTSGSGQTVVLLHGWPGDRRDYRGVVPLLAPSVRVVTVDLRGFGGSDKHPVDPAVGYGAAAQADSVVALIEGLGVSAVVIGGYDIGSRVAQTVAEARPDLVRALVISPPVPGVGTRVMSEHAHREFWYQQFHHLGLAEELLDGRRDAILAYLRHFWTHWSGPDFTVPPDLLAELADGYSSPGAFTASIGWYRAGAGTVARSLRERTPGPEQRLAVPTTVLWPEHDPLFPRAWSDRLGEFFADVTLCPVDGIGHFLPVEAPQRFAQEVLQHVPARPLD